MAGATYCRLVQCALFFITLDTTCCLTGLTVEYYSLPQLQSAQHFHNFYRQLKQELMFEIKLDIYFMCPTVGTFDY